jgi:hypothetical protein
MAFCIHFFKFQAVALNNTLSLWLYLSHLTFNVNYTYVQGTTFKHSYIEIYHLNSLVSSDPLVCREHKKWIESYRKYSMLISADGEKERTDFFRLQERFVKRLR